MSKIPRQYFPLVFVAPDDIKHMILSLQEVCTARNVDLRTTGTAKVQHIIAEALGYKGWQQLLAHNHYFKVPPSSQAEPEEPVTRELKLTEDERAALLQSRTGRFAIDEVYFYEQCRKWRKEVEDYWAEVSDLAWQKYRWEKLDVPVEERPQRPKTMTLTGIEATDHGVEMGIGEKDGAQFTVNLMLGVEDDFVDCPWGILTFHTWATYHIALDYMEVESIAAVYRPEIVATLEEAGVI